MIDPTPAVTHDTMSAPDDPAEPGERLRLALLDAEAAQLRAYDTIARLAHEIGFPLARSPRVSDPPPVSEP